MQANRAKIHSELLQYFLKYLDEDAQKSTTVIQNMARDVQRFFAFLEERNREISAFEVRSYIDALQEEYSRPSFISKLSNLRQFVNWLNLKDNPFVDLHVPESHHKNKYYSYDEIFENYENYSLQTKIIVSFIYEFYLSITELQQVCIGDINFATGALRIRNVGIPASERLQTLIKEYLNTERKDFANEDNLTAYDFLLIHASGRKINSTDIRSRLSDIGLQALPLKRSRIMHFLELDDSAIRLGELEAELGVKLGDHYRAHAKDYDYRLLTAYNQFHPRAGL